MDEFLAENLSFQVLFVLSGVKFLTSMEASISISHCKFSQAPKLSNFRTSNIPVSGPMIQAKAISFAQTIRKSEFKASNGWLSRFKIRHNINCAKVCGESGSVNQMDVDECLRKLPSIVSGYELVLDACYWLASAVKSVKKTAVKKCFAKSGLGEDILDTVSQQKNT